MTLWWTMILMIVCSFFSALATFFIKKATPNITRKKFIKSLFNHTLMLGVFLYGFGTLFSLIALKFGELSVLYPFVALQYVWTSFLSVKYLGEHMGMKWWGIALIFLGVTLIGLGA